MSDFDDVLERLLSDPSFKDRLAADPAAALAGYRLNDEELEILQAQVGFDTGAQSRVEQRTSKASMFGLFSSLGAGISDVIGGHGHGHGLGDAIASAGQHAEHGLEQAGAGRPAASFDAGQPADSGLSHNLAGVEQAMGGHDGSPSTDFDGVQAYAGPDGAYASSGGVYASAGGGYAESGLAEAQPNYGEGGLAEAPTDGGYGSGGVAEASGGRGALHSPGGYDYGDGGLAEAEPDGQGQAGIAEAQQGGGTVYRSSTYISGTARGLSGVIGQSGLSPSPQEGHGLSGLVGDSVHLGAGQSSFAERHGLDGLVDDVRPQAPTDGYHTRVDWDGDGRWDEHTYVNRPDGGVDIVVDADGDGRAEFIGHDTDRDGLINSSEVDTNRDGVMDARYEDVNGDGWLDRRTR